MGNIASGYIFTNPPGTLADAQVRINAEIAAVRATGGNNSRFFTQTSSAPVLQDNQSFLINIQPLTAYLGGYLGQPEGLFNANYFLQTAFAAGIRSFHLPISTYMNPSKVPPTWPYSGMPVIAARDTTDTIVSVNAISVSQFIEALVEYKSVSGYSTEPIILILEDALSELDRSKINYAKFMVAIAKQLQPLDTFRLTTAGSYGSVVGGLNQKKLLTEIPLNNFDNKVIIFTNFDVSQDSTQSLASYANFIYSDGDNTLPVREVALEDISGSQTDWISKARTNWYIAKSKTPLVAPDAATIKKAFANGIQCVPVPLLSTPMEKISTLWPMWGGASYALKVNETRYTRPSPVVPHMLNARLNASLEGKEPGSLVVR